MKKYEELIPKIKYLPKQEIDLIVVDFDDTIFSRKEQLEKLEILRQFRGNEGNKVIRDILGIENFIDEYYKGKDFPNTITSLLRENLDLILTAGFDEIQKAKLKATGLDKYNYIIVYESITKVYELIRYVIEDLGFIPEKIIVYEDRINVFLENKDFIEKFLGTKLEIMEVKMNSNKDAPIIKKIT